MNRWLWSVGLLLSQAVFTVQAEVDSSRIASVDANATEILQALGMTDQLVAVDMTSQPLLPTSVSVPDLGYHRLLSAEGILSSEPTLVIGSSHMGPPAVVDTIETTDIELIRLPAANSMAGLIENIELLGNALGKSSASQQLVAKIEQQQSAISEAQNGQSLSMIFLLDLTGRGLSKAGQGTTGESLVQLLGGQNLSDYAGYKTISMESVLELNPDVILVGSRDTNADAAAELLADNPLLQHTNAVQNQRMLTVDASLMVAGVSPGVMQEAQRLSQLIFQ